MIVVFTGPTIAPEEARKIADAVYLGPVSQGDVYRASLDRPAAIAIIDGYFEHVPSVWHKEILYALSQGVHVFGSSSMGALRAAELERFGMVGVGAIFRAFRDGVLEDDDEVAVAHGPAEAGFRAASEAMVNIRATLDAARARNMISEETRGELVRLAKSTFYAQRSFPALLERAGRSPELEAFAAALPEVAIDQKRLDAVELLQTLAEFAKNKPPPKEVSFYFHHTEVWDQVSRRLGRQQLTAHRSVQNQLLIDELRLLGSEAWSNARAATLFRALALEYAERAGVSASPELMRDAAAALHRRHALQEGELDGWIAQQDLDEAGFTALLQREARVRWVEALFEADVQRLLQDELRAEGKFGALSRRALDKQTRLEAEGLSNPSLEDAGLTEAQLFEAFVGAERWGFGERAELIQILLREYLYRRLLKREA